MPKIFSPSLLIRMHEIARLACEAPSSQGIYLCFPSQQEAILARKQLYRSRRMELERNPNSLMPIVTVETRIVEKNGWKLHVFPQGGLVFTVPIVEVASGDSVEPQREVPLTDEELREAERQGEILQIQEELLAATWPPRKAAWKAEMLHKAGHRPGDPAPEYNGRHDRALYVDPRAKTYAGA